MTYDAQTPTIAPVTPSWVFGLLVRGGRSVLKGAHTFLISLQVARMMATLSNMSDHQLAQIGINRSEISDYAEKLVKDA